LFTSSNYRIPRIPLTRNTKYKRKIISIEQLTTIGTCFWTKKIFAWFWPNLRLPKRFLLPYTMAVPMLPLCKELDSITVLNFSKEFGAGLSKNAITELNFLNKNSSSASILACL
jgi:hypothetical protein